jgi:hypothetical protein
MNAAELLEQIVAAREFLALGDDLAADTLLSEVEDDLAKAVRDDGRAEL